MEYLPSITREADALAAAARAAGPDETVPSCPDWNVHDLVVHTGTTHRWATTLVRTRAQSFLPPSAGEVPDDAAATLEWFEAGATELVEVMEATDPSEPVWSWGDDHHARFWARRMAHETAVHAWDASSAAGKPAPIDGELAVDGIDELLEHLPFMVAFRPEIERLGGAGETIHLHATDREGEWLIQLTPDGVTFAHGHAKGDVAARGSASDLWLFLAGRVSPDQLEVFGDRTLLERWQRDFAF